MIPGLKKRALNLRKHARLMALLMCFSLLCGLVYYIYARPVYLSKALVEMDYMPLPMDTERLFHDSRMRAVIKDLQSPNIVERTARRFGIKGSARDIQLKHVLKTTVRMNSEKNLDIEVWPTSRDLAAHWAEALVEEYEAYRAEKHERDKEEIYDSYTRELKDAAARMGESLDENFQIRSEQDAIHAAIELQKVKSLPAEIVRMSKRIDDMGRLRIKLEDASLDMVSKLSIIAKLEKDPQLAAKSQLNPGDEVHLPGVEPDKSDDSNKDSASSSIPAQPQSQNVIIQSLAPAVSVWQELEKDQQRLKSEIAENSITYLPGHPVMQGLQKEFDTVTQKLEVEYQVAKKRFELEYQDILNRRAEIEGGLDDDSRVAKQGEQVKQTLVVSQKSRPNWERMISDMQKKLESLDYGWKRERVDLTFVSLVDNHVLPVSPNREKLVLMWLGVGFLLALGVPFLVEYLDHTMHDLDEVEATFQLRNLGIVPKLDAHLLPALIDRASSEETSLVENFRVIRTNLLSMAASTNAPHVIMVTSAMPKEGKTAVSSNLALSFAHNGARTLVIDTDFRCGRMHRLFGYRKNPGLSNVLLDEVTIEEACRPTSHPNLFILSAGKHLDTGTELLGSEKFGCLMATLRERYDRIIVDTPPVLGLSEACILQKHVDGVLFVIWSGHTPIRNMKAAIETLQANGANFYGFILNRLDLNATQDYHSQEDNYNYAPQAVERA